MAMKKFTPAQQLYVSNLQASRAALGNTMREVRAERDKLESQLQEAVNHSVKAQAESDAELIRYKGLHRDLLHAVEDYLEAETGKVMADRRHEGAIGLLGDMHSDHNQQTQEANVMGFAPDPEGAFGWRRTR